MIFHLFSKLKILFLSIYALEDFNKIIKCLLAIEMEKMISINSYHYTLKFKQNIKERLSNFTNLVRFRFYLLRNRKLFDNLNVKRL